MTDQPTRSRPAHHDNSALWERVESHGSMIRTLAEETSSQFRDFRAEMATQIAGVLTSVDKIASRFEANTSAMNAKFEANTASMNERQRPQWLGIIAAAVGAVGLSVTITASLTGLHDKPVDDKLTSNTLAIADLTRNTAQAFSDAAKVTVSTAEFNKTIDFENRISDVKTAQRRENDERLEAIVAKYGVDLVPRAEHQFHWDAEAKTDERLEQEVVSLQRRLDMLAPAGDTLKALEEHQHELELRVFGGVK